MKSATRILRNRIILIFDFDATLGPGSTGVLFKELGMDYDSFQKQVNKYHHEEMWQYALAKAEMLRVYSYQEGSPLNKKAMEQVGKEYPLFEGVETLTERLREFTAELDQDIKLEFVLLTAGFGTIPKASKVGETFDRVYCGELLFDEDGKVLGAKRVITHVDKVHYIRQLQEGIELTDPSDLENTYLQTDPDDHYVPMSQIIYVGDGASDMSAFQAVEEGGGIAIAVDPEGSGDNWEGYDQMEVQRRVHNIAKAEFGEEDELYKSLKLAIHRMVKDIELLRFGKDE